MKSIQTKLTALLLISVIAASLTIGFIGMLTVSDTLQTNAEKNMGLVCDLNTKKLDAIFESIEMSTNIIADSAANMLEDTAMLRNPEFRSSYITSVTRESLGVFINATEGISGVYFCVNPDVAGETDGFFWISYLRGSEYYNHEVEDLAFDSNGEISIADHFKDIDSLVGGKWSESVYNPKVGMYLNTYSVPVIKDNVYIGEVGMCVSGNNIRNIITETSVYKTGFAAVLDSNGAVLYHPEYSHGEKLNIVADNSMKLSDIVSMNRQSDNLISYTSNGQDRKMIFSTLRIGARLCIIAPTREILEEHDILVVKIISFIVVIMLLAMIVLYFFAQRLTKPILELNNATREMTMGNLDAEIVSLSNDEIGELAMNFNEARSRIKNYINDLHDEAQRDGLTGVNNKIAYDKTAERINKLVADGEYPFGIAIFDVNNLKMTNDVLGHLAGDELLTKLAECLVENFDHKFVYRIGGDEFVIIAEGDMYSEILQRIDEVAEKINRATLPSYPTVKLSCAHGVAEFDAQRDNCVENVLARADRRMYTNKANALKVVEGDDAHKGVKQLQIEKYIEFLRVLNQSTEDYMFLFDIESDRAWFFGNIAKEFEVCNNPESVATFAEVYSIVHDKEKDQFKNQLEDVITARKTELDINHRWIDRNGNPVWINLRGKVLCDEIGNPFIAIGRASSNELRSQFNPLTGLLNSNKFVRDFQGEAIHSFSHAMLINIDDLSALNLKYGRRRADEFIRVIARALDERFAHNSVYHMDQAEFFVLLDTDSTDEMEKIFESILDSLDDNFTVSAAVVPSDMSLYGDKYTMYEYAKMLLKEKYSEGAGKIWFFSGVDHIKTIADAELFEELERSVYNGCPGFYLCYQPKVNATGYQVAGAEALLRYDSPERGTVYPNVFIPILEQSGLINEVGIWVLSTALRQCKEWRRSNPDFRISVNFSSVQFKNETIVERVLGLLKTYKLPGDALIIEVTESIKLEDTDALFDMFDAFRNAGISISIDDFGTGYSNLSYLQKLHADEIKIDRIFINDITDTTYNYRIVKNIIEFAKANSLSVCLEGVEKADELAVIARLGADTLQGYLFNKPLPADEFEIRYIDKDNEHYIAKQKYMTELQYYTNKMQRIHIDTKDILSKLDTGLWVMRVDRATKEGELFFDSTMRKQMGVSEKDSTRDCFEMWYKRISPDFNNIIFELFNRAYSSGETLNTEYVWIHPDRGEVIGRFTVKCAEINDDFMLFEGFHRIISDVVGVDAKN